jgi:glycoside/pentoside/hexuronide:cation symporter, GPH family
MSEAAPFTLNRATVARFATAATPMAVMGLPFTVYLPPYVAEGGTIGVAWVGVLFTLTIFWDGLVDPIIGMIIDRRSTGAAPHRRWIRLAALPLAVLLLAIVTIGDALPFWALLPLLLVFFSCFSLFDVAHLSWGSALAGSQDDSARLFGAREWAAKLVLLAAFGAPALAQLLMPDISLQGRILAYASLVIIALPLALWAISGLPARPIAPPEPVDWRRELGTTTQFPALLTLLGMQLASAFGFGSMTALFIYYADGVLGLAQQSSALLFMTFIGGALTTPLWTMLSRRIGKRRGIMVMGLMLSTAILMAMVAPPSGMVQTSIFSTVLGSGFVGLLFIYGLVADIAPLDQARSGRDRTGLLYALINVMQKGGNALAIGATYGLLSLVSFNPQAATGSADAIRILFGLLPAAGWLSLALLAIRLGREPALA